MKSRDHHPARASKTSKVSKISKAMKAQEVPSRNYTEAWLRVDTSQHPESTAHTGKWMLFVRAVEVDEVWVQIKAATVSGDLGSSAKVSTVMNNLLNPRSQGVQLHAIMVYTRDYRDLEDVARVLQKLRDMGFVGRLSYKEDAATLSNIYGGGAALYVAQPGALSFECRRDPFPAP